MIRSIPFPDNSEYFADRRGNIYTTKKNTFKKLHQSNARGYRTVCIFSKNWLAHRLIALVFIPNPENKPFINHKNGIKDDNRVENLEWVTPLENVRHAHKTGLASTLHYTGSNCLLAKLNEGQVYEIKHLLDEGAHFKIIAEWYDTTVTNIENILYHASWKQIKRKL